jgi:hypothetical protein
MANKSMTFRGREGRGEEKKRREERRKGGVGVEMKKREE